MKLDSLIINYLPELKGEFPDDVWKKASELALNSGCLREACVVYYNYLWGRHVCMKVYPVAKGLASDLPAVGRKESLFFVRELGEKVDAVSLDTIRFYAEID